MTYFVAANDYFSNVRGWMVQERVQTATFWSGRGCESRWCWCYLQWLEGKKLTVFVFQFLEPNKLFEDYYKCIVLRWFVEC